MTNATTDTTNPIGQFASGIAMHHATRAKATRLMQLLSAEYPRLQLLCDTEEDDEGNERAIAFEVEMDGEDELIWTGPKVPELADILDACAERELNPTTAEEEEEAKVSGSVVPEAYRTQYRAASSNGQTCGDWLAEWLVTETNSKTFSVPDFKAICENNGLDMTKPWARLPESGQQGWVGRYRMNGRQALEKIVAQVGTVTDAIGVKHEVPQSFLDTIRAKHAKWLAKQAKIEEAALATAGKTADEATA